MQAWLPILASALAQQAAQSEEHRPEVSGFRQFSPTHFVTVGVCLLVLVGVAYLARRLRSGRYANVMRFWVVWLLVAVQCVSIVYYMWPWDWTVSLPLHICDLVGIIAIGAIATESRVLRATLHYWGIALSTQAFITPVLFHGPDHARFYVFWVTHLAIVSGAVYDIVARGYRPRWKDFWIITGVTLAYAAVVIPLDIVLKANYGFAGADQEEGATTLLAVLGPWPLRLVWMFVLSEAVFAGLTVLWMVSGRSDRTPPTLRADGSAGSR